MLRISETGGSNGHVVLKLEGSVAGPWVGELAAESGRVLETGQTLKLDLTEVSFVDREGVKLLLALKGRNAILEGMSPFVGEELREAAKPGKL